MPIKKLHLHHLRHFDSLIYEPGSKVNLIVGSNGAGKTSILEAVYILSTGRSFRTNTLLHAIQENAEGLTVYAELSMAHAQNILNIGFQRERNSATPLIKVNGKRETKISELAKSFPVKLLQVDNYQLLRNDSLERRQLLDWGVFHVEHSFHTGWQQYQRLLKHRNTLLKMGISASAMECWTEQLIVAGRQVHAARETFMLTWQEVLQDFIEKLLDLRGITVEYYPGWSKGDIAEVITNNFSNDSRVGHTQHGPHRADIVVTFQGIPAKQRLSLGQQKMLVVALHLSQAYLLMQKAKKETVFLLDDLPAELDNEAQRKTSIALRELDAQVLMTCVDKSVAQAFIGSAEVDMFHVEHNKLCEPA